MGTGVGLPRSRGSDATRDADGGGAAPLIADEVSWSDVRSHELEVRSDADGDDMVAAVSAGLPA